MHDCRASSERGCKTRAEQYGTWLHQLHKRRLLDLGLLLAECLGCVAFNGVGCTLFIGGANSTCSEWQTPQTRTLLGSESTAAHKLVGARAKSALIQTRVAQATLL